MAITHVQAVGSNGSKTTGTTLAVTATPSPLPAIGDLIVVACARDDIANDPLTGDSCSDGYGNTYTRLGAYAGTVTAGSNSTAGDTVLAVIFYSVLTVAWSGSTTVTWTHPSLDARGMQVEHFAPTSGYTILFQEVVNDNAAGSSTFTITAQLLHPTVPGDLVFGMTAVAIDSTSSITGDSDTNGGASWSAITANAGTSGGTPATNVFVATQYKVGQTLPFAQGYSTSGFTSAECIAVVASFHEIPPTGIAFVGGSKQAFYAGAAISPAIPPNSTTSDLLLMVIGGRPSSAAADGISIASGADGWAQHGSTSYLAVASADDVSVQLWWKIHDGSESAPSVSANTVLTASGGYSAQILAFRRMNTSTPFDVTPVNSNSAAAATWAPTAVTTNTANAMAISVVTTSDDNALNFNTAQGFTLVFGGTEYDDTTGTDYAVGTAYKIVSSPGSVTQPTWNQSVNGNDSWVGIATALLPGGTAYTLDGSTGLTTTVSGDLTVAFPLAGSTTLTTALTGDLAAVHPFAASTAVTTAATGALTVAHPLAATTVLTTTLAGDLAATYPLTAATALTTALAGDLTVARPLTASTSLTTATFGDLTVAFPLAATTALTTALAGDLTVVRNHLLEGATAFTTALTGDVTVAHPLAGTTTLTTGDDGTLTLTVVLALEGATSLTVAVADGDLIAALVLTGGSSLTTALLAELTEILGPNAFLLGRVVASVVDTSIRANVVTPIVGQVVVDRIEVSVR